MTTIIIAALAVLVLIVLALMFSGRMKIFGGETTKCENLGGTCESMCDDNEMKIKALCDGDPDGLDCCLDKWEWAEDTDD